MNVRAKKKADKVFYWVKLAVGVLSLIVGIAGIALPILPGWILIFLGLELVGIKLVVVDNIKAYAQLKLKQEKEKRGKR